MSEEHWSGNFEHESLAAPEAREAFSSAMSKYDTEQSAVMGGYNAIKLAGKPYKLPESVDKLPEEMREEFTTNARKTLGIEAGVKSIEDLADINLSDGLPEGHPVNDAFADSFKKFAVENGYTKADIQKLVGFNNQAVSGMLEQIQAKQLETAKTTNEALVKHFGSEDKVTEQSEMVKRWFKDQSGLTAEEYESVGGELADSVFTKNPVLSRVFMEHFAKLSKEGSTENGKGGNTPVTSTLESATIAESPKTAKALGWE